MARQCECCKIMATTGLGFVCRCEEELFCLGCNRCVRHCRCAAPEVTVPMAEQLAVAKDELRKMGVAV